MNTTVQKVDPCGVRFVTLHVGMRAPAYPARDVALSGTREEGGVLVPDPVSSQKWHVVHLTLPLNITRREEKGGL